MSRSQKIEKAQNESKRAVANAVAAEVESLNKTLTRSADDLLSVVNRLGQSWQGQAFTSLSQAMLSYAEELKSTAVNAKNLASRIKNAAREVYP